MRNSYEGGEGHLDLMRALAAKGKSEIDDYSAELERIATSSALVGKFEHAGLLLEPARQQKDSDESCRFYRRFGIHFFLKVFLKKDDFSRFDHFVTSGIRIAGRHFQYLRCKPREKHNEEWVVVFYAGDIEKLKSWHMPAGTPIKRLKLGFTPTVPTIKLTTLPEPAEDIISEDDHLMTDGCGLVSPQLMQKLHQKYLEHPSSPEHRQGYVPAAAQIRIGPYKGMLLTSRLLKGDEIHLRKSQCKYNLIDPDEFQRTVEVKEFSTRVVQPASLNEQFIVLLSELGVKPMVFFALLKEHLVDIARISEPAVAKKRISRQTTDEEEFIALRMLDAELDDEYYLRYLLHKLALRDMKGLRPKLKIRVEKSRYAFMVPDPTGILPPGTIYFNYSCRDGTYKEATGTVILARNPCYHPGDIRKVNTFNGLKKEWSDILKDVIVISTKGSVSVATMLAGGDFDGDKAFLAWDERLVEQCNPVEPFDYNALDAETKNSASSSNGDASITWAEAVKGKDILGKLSNLHLKYANQNMKSKCLYLHKLIQLALDCPDQLPPNILQVLRMKWGVKNPSWWNLRKPGSCTHEKDITKKTEAFILAKLYFRFDAFVNTLLKPVTFSGQKTCGRLSQALEKYTRKDETLKVQIEKYALSALTDYNESLKVIINTLNGKKKEKAQSDLLKEHSDRFHRIYEEHGTSLDIVALGYYSVCPYEREKPYQYPWILKPFTLHLCRCVADMIEQERKADPYAIAPTMTWHIYREMRVHREWTAPKWESGSFPKMTMTPPASPKGKRRANEVPPGSPQSPGKKRATPRSAMEKLVQGIQRVQLGDELSFNVAQWDTSI